ncbi:hypothetical protein A4X09_0g14 [Tilletia walkeri]|uniref:Uncharacterized protein n=1 Tax=Tilletia walkeri TaxID=117179 RepID=A0A8X7NI51_9BASI|nr:hypothetical protein A4X09_0g14 [Tilletia walkeri]
MPSMSSTSSSNRSRSWLVQVATSLCVLLVAASTVSAVPTPGPAAAVAALPRDDSAPAAPQEYLNALKVAAAVLSAANTPTSVIPAQDPSSTITTTWLPGSTAIVGTTTFLPNGGRIEPKPNNHASIAPGKANELILSQLKAYAAAASSSAVPPIRLSETLPADSSTSGDGPVQLWNQASGVDTQMKRIGEEQIAVEQNPAHPATPAISSRDVVLAAVAEIRAEVLARQAQEQKTNRRELASQWAGVSGMNDQAARLAQQKAAMAAAGSSPQQQKQGAQSKEGVATLSVPASSSDATGSQAPAAVSSELTQRRGSQTLSKKEEAAVLDPQAAKRIFFRWTKSTIAK